jgi:hypothetical protein
MFQFLKCRKKPKVNWTVFKTRNVVPLYWLLTGSSHVYIYILYIYIYNVYTYAVYIYIYIYCVCMYVYIYSYIYILHNISRIASFRIIPRCSKNQRVWDLERGCSRLKHIFFGFGTWCPNEDAMSLSKKTNACSIVPGNWGFLCRGLQRDWNNSRIFKDIKRS